MTAKAPKTGRELADYYKKVTVGAQITGIMLNAGLLSYVKDSRTKLFIATDKGKNKKFKMKSLLDRHFIERAKSYSKQSEKSPDASTTVNPVNVRQEPRNKPTRPYKLSTQLPLFDVTAENSELLTWEEWVRKAKAAGYVITKQL